MLPSASGRHHGDEFACAGADAFTSTWLRNPQAFGLMARRREVLQPLPTAKGFPRFWRCGSRRVYGKLPSEERAPRTRWI